MNRTIFNDQLFKDKVVLITGGGTGIGLATAVAFGELGAKVIIASRKEAHLEQGLKALNKADIQGTSIECNIRDTSSVQTCIATILEKYGQLDIVINNAGGQFPSPAQDISDRGWQAVIDTNLNGTFYVCREAFNQYFQENGGIILNVIANMWRGFPLMAHTGAARAGVDNLTKSLATEWGRHGVRVNAVAPGVIASSGLQKYDPKIQPLIYQQAKNNQTSRLGSEAEVAEAILFLCSPAAAFITGETLKIDGGESLYHPLMPPTENPNTPAYSPSARKAQES